MKMGEATTEPEHRLERAIRTVPAWRHARSAIRG